MKTRISVEHLNNVHVISLALHETTEANKGAHKNYGNNILFYKDFKS